MMDMAGRQWGSVIQTFKLIFECENEKEYSDDFSTHLGIQRVKELRSFIGDHYLWYDSHGVSLST